MKKVLAIAAVAMISVGAFAQGTITWGNSTTSKIRFADGPNAGSPVFPGANYVVGLYLGAAGSTTADALSLVTTRTFHTGGTSAAASLAGVFLNQTYTSQTYNTGTAISYMIKAWSAGFASYEAALMDPAGAAYAGASGIGGGSLGGGTTPAFAASLDPAGIAPGAVGMGKVAPFTISIVPEPASASLLGLGLASLLIFRRRK